MNTSIHNQTEILIVGQGIAGTLLAFFLWKRGLPFRVIDQPLPGASTSVAAGIINPITGWRMAKSWRFEELAPWAAHTYIELGELLGVPVFSRKNIVVILPDVFTENEWERRSAFPENTAYFCEKPAPDVYSPFLRTFHGLGELTGAAKVDMPLLVRSFRDFLLQQGLLDEAFFDFGEMKPGADYVTYQGRIYKKIMFCEGAKAVQNPYFSHLPFAPTKGELLLVKIKGLQADKMLKNKIYIVPLGDELYWVGATNANDCSSSVPTPEKRDFLETCLRGTLDLPYQVIAHKAGIRPTVADRRPIVGFHRQYPCLGIFNGLGTKGASLGPFFAAMMAGCLAGERPIEAEVDLGRFAGV